MFHIAFGNVTIFRVSIPRIAAGLLQLLFCRLQTALQESFPDLRNILLVPAVTYGYISRRALLEFCRGAVRRSSSSLREYNSASLVLICSRHYD